MTGTEFCGTEKNTCDIRDSPLIQTPRLKISQRVGSQMNAQVPKRPPAQEAASYICVLSGNRAGTQAHCLEYKSHTERYSRTMATLRGT